MQPRDYFPPPTIVGLLEDEGATALLSLLEQSNMLDRLEREGSYTLFAPTSEALSSLDSNIIRDITEDLSLLEDVMRYHLVPGGKIFTRIMKNDLLAETALDGAKVRFNSANASRAEVLAVNGALLEEGRTDQRASNGVVHFIDDLLYPVPNKALFDLLDDDGRFVTLTRALEVAGLTELLSSAEADGAPVSLTIFAPTDDAFSRVPQQALDELLEDRAALGSLLAGHLVKGSLLSPALAFASLDTIGGGQMRVQARKGKVTVSLDTSKATLVDGDLLATNGAVQVIDRVLL